MTRPIDVAHAASLGARYVGVIFAGGPRIRTAEEAARLFEGVPSSVKRVGVFGEQTPEEIKRTAELAGLDVAQLHGVTSTQHVSAVKRVFAGEVWAAVRLAVDEARFDVSKWFDAADAVLIDAYVPGTLGGTGVALPWGRLRESVDAVRRGRKLVLAGGLKPENVATAIAELGPDVVDVSSGVESSAGVKSHERMNAFADAVRHAQAASRVRTGESVRT